jgi:hypothetical protein
MRSTARPGQAGAELCWRSAGPRRPIFGAISGNAREGRPSKNGWLESVVEPGVKEEPASGNRPLEAESARSKATSRILVLGPDGRAIRRLAASSARRDHGINLPEEVDQCHCEESRADE